jgi:hypothetical protein
MPRDSKEYNKLLIDETQYYKDCDFTYNNKKDVTGLLETIKSKYKQLKLKTYDIKFCKTE